MTAPAQEIYEVQGTLALQGVIAHGWCHSPERPGKALRVEILADGAVVAAGVAARLQLELVRPGITEGYHGFALPLPPEALAGCMLEARESVTGQVFARRLPAQPRDLAGWQRDIALLERGLQAMHRMIDQQPSAHAGLAAAFEAVGGVHLKKIDVGILR
ncbi:hypothetical protein [Acidisoma sp. 7E03]